MRIDKNTGELLPENIMEITEKAPAIIIDVSEVALFHTEPMKLVEKINSQAGYMVFDIQTKKGRDACRAHAAQIIKCIAPACNESRRLADQEKKVVNQDLNFRRLFNAGVREIAEYHRKPLTEWEKEQARIAEQERIFAEKMEVMRLYQIDWDDAIAYDELFTLRKEKEDRDAAYAILRQREEKENHKKQEQIICNSADPVTISKNEYLKLKTDSARLHEITELWAQYERMLEAAQRASSSYDMRNEQIEAGKIQRIAINLIKGVEK